MLKLLKKSSVVFLLPLISVIINGCAEDPKPTLLDLIGPTNEPPVISSIEPSGEAIAGVNEVTITGSNFSTVPSENLVSFNGAFAEVLSSSSSQLVVQAPNVIADSVAVKVAISGDNNVEYFSNIMIYKLTPAVAEIVNSNGDPIFSENTLTANGLTSDQQDNLYVSVIMSGSSDGVKKISTDGTLTDFAPAGNETKWDGLKYGPAGVIYGSKLLRGVWQIFENTVPTNAPWSVLPSGTRIIDVDFDPDLNVWAVGNNNLIYGIAPNGESKGFAFTANLRSVRYFSNSLYVAGQKDGAEGIWEIPAISDSLDTQAAELYFSFSETDSAGQINAITFSADGDLVIGTDKQIDPIYIVYPDKSSEILYPGVILNGVLVFSWGTGNYIYFTGIEEGYQTVFVINMQEGGAPYYGRN